MKEYLLQHYHKGDWWGLGLRTGEQIATLLEEAQDIIRTEHEISFRLAHMFSEPLFRVLIFDFKEEK